MASALVCRPADRRAAVLHGEHEYRADRLCDLGALLREHGEVLLHLFGELLARLSAPTTAATKRILAATPSGVRSSGTST